MVEIDNLGIEHHILCDGGILILPTVNQRLDILALVLLPDDGRNKPQLPLNHIHHQTGCSTIAVNPRVNGYQTEVGLKTQAITISNVCPICFTDFFIEPSAKIID